MSIQNKLLIIPDKQDAERDALAQSWEIQGGQVLRIGKFWKAPHVNPQQVSLYGFDTFCLVLAQLLELELIEVEDKKLAELSNQWLKRKVELYPQQQISSIEFPTFIKPTTPKLFKAAIYQDQSQLDAVMQDIEDEILLMAEIIEITAEARAFVLNTKILDLSIYEGRGDEEEAKAFLSQFLAAQKGQFPITFVVDLAHQPERGWCVLEFNSSWGAGLNGCSPDKVWPAVQAATILPSSP